METYNLNTTQNVSLQYKIASIGDRILAYLIDMLIMAIYSAVILVFVFDADLAGWQLVFLIPVLLYHFLWESFFNGQSPGKMIMRIRVLKTDGSQLTLGSCFIRWIFRLPDITLMMGSIAVLVLIVNGKGQRIGDIAASTTVLKIPSKTSLSDSVWMEVDEQYTPVFYQANTLTDKDIHIIREVLEATEKSPQLQENIILMYKTRDAIIKKTSIESALPDREFLTTIVKDYNAIYRAELSEA